MLWFIILSIDESAESNWSEVINRSAIRIQTSLETIPASNQNHCGLGDLLFCQILEAIVGGKKT